MSNGFIRHGSSTNQTFSGNAGSQYNLTKTGANTLVLSGRNSYTGRTRINQGALELGGVNAAGNLGSGRYANTVDVGTGTALNLLSTLKPITINTPYPGSANSNIVYPSGGNGYFLFAGTDNSTYTLPASPGVPFGTPLWFVSGGNGAPTNIVIANTDLVTPVPVPAGATDAYSVLFVWTGALWSFQGGYKLAANNPGDARFTNALNPNSPTSAELALNPAYTRGDTVIVQSFDGIVSGAGAITRNAPGAVAFTARNTFSSALTITQGSAIIGNGVTTGTLLPFTTPIVNNGLVVFNVALTLNISGAVSGTGTMLKIGGGTLTLGGGNTFTGAITVSGGRIQSSSLFTGKAFGDAASITVNTGGTLHGQGWRANYSNPVILNGGTVQLISFGEFTNWLCPITLTAPSNIIAQASVQVVDIKAINLAAHQLTIDATATNVSWLTRFSGVISGTGNIVKTGVGTVRLQGANTYTGGTTISGGLVQINNATALSSGATVVGNGATLTYLLNTTGTRTVTVNAGGVINRGGFAHTGTTFVNNGGTINL